MQIILKLCKYYAGLSKLEIMHKLCTMLLAAAPLLIRPVY